LQGSSSEVGVVPEAFCGGGAGTFELDFTRPKPQAYTVHRDSSEPQRKIPTKLRSNLSDAHVWTLHVGHVLIM